MSDFGRLLDQLVLQGQRKSELDRVNRKTGKHRTQTLPRRNVVGRNLYGMTLPAAVQRPDILRALRASQGSQAVHGARRRKALRAAFGVEDIGGAA